MTQHLLHDSARRQRLHSGTECATLAHMSTALLTVNEAAARLRMSRRSVYRLIDTDQLPHVRGLTPGAPVRLRPEDLDDFVAKRTTPGTVADSVAS